MRVRKRCTGAEQLGLRHHLEIAGGGRRQIVFVTGEPGIGKTTLVEAFLREVSGSDQVVTTHGQCIEQYGAGEAYMPILDALERMCNGPNGEKAVELLRHHAPSWLVNLSALGTSEERSELERQTIGITPERRLREMAAFLEAVATNRTVLLLLEDLHWADPSTLALISFLARRREAARLMLIGTYREGEVERLNHPLKATKQELQLHDLCKHLPLKFLTRGAVGEYLAARFETPHVSSKVLSTVYRRSEGNPLFMVNVTDYLVTEEAIVQQNGTVELTNESAKEIAPTNIHELIERQFESLDPEDQQLLEVASVAGMSFSAAAVAAGLGRPVEQVEDRCEKLVEHEQFLQASGTSRWPDGTVASRYAFIHALYENEIYERLPDSRRARLHQSIGERIETAHQDATGQVAAELALHFECAGDYNRAIGHLLQAAERAMRQCGYEEAINHANKGLALVKSLTRQSAHTESILAFELMLGVCFSALKGFGAIEAKDAFSRARDLCPMAGKSSSLFRALAGLWSFYVVGGDLRLALELAEEMLKLGKQARNQMFLLHGHVAAGMPHCHLGGFTAARSHLERSSSLYLDSTLGPKRPSMAGMRVSSVPVTPPILSGFWVIPK